ncbi:MAG: glycerol-3-phosphate 1-O-acyltransferase PlsY [Gammaproteobacteria bacterium]|nr:glycerol-3-phosphate 1-O-acyltransferase PlsY [Gammaproteobacteria bacterium]
MTITEIVLIVCAYLIGSISSAILVCKLMHLPDPRAHGSGNPGATNVLRVGGKKAAAITLFGDMLKGLLPALVAQLLGVSFLALALTGFAAFIGHLLPIFFGFKGGKGVATMLGVMFGFHWAVGLATALTWLLVAKVFKISSLSALVATVLAPFYVLLIMGSNKPLIIATAVMTLILFWRHRSNIQNLLSGKEGRIGKSS